VYVCVCVCVVWCNQNETIDMSVLSSAYLVHKYIFQYHTVQNTPSQLYSLSNT